MKTVVNGLQLAASCKFTVREGLFAPQLRSLTLRLVIPVHSVVIPSEARNVGFAESRWLMVDSDFRGAGYRAPEALCQVRHLHRRHCRFESFVTHLQAGAVDSLLQSFAGKHAESVRHASLLSGLPDPAGYFVHDYVVVRCVAAQQAAQADDRIIFACLGELSRRYRNLERAWDTHQRNVFLLRAGAQQSVDCAQQQPLGDESIEPRNHNGEAFPAGVHRAFERVELWLGNGLDSEILIGVFWRDWCLRAGFAVDPC